MNTKKAIILAVITGTIGLATGIQIPTSPQGAYIEHYQQSITAMKQMVSNGAANDVLIECYAHFSSDHAFKAQYEKSCEQFFLKELPHHSAMHKAKGTPLNFKLGPSLITEAYNHVQDYKRNHGHEVYPALSDLSHGLIDN